jgi:hypothetical protein
MLVQVSFTCVEMRDCEQPYEAACGPEALLKLIIDTASAEGVAVTGENALQRYLPASCFVYNTISFACFVSVAC